MSIDSSQAIDLCRQALLLAAMLAKIKSRMLLPRSEEGEEDDLFGRHVGTPDFGPIAR